MPAIRIDDAIDPAETGYWLANLLASIGRQRRGRQKRAG